MEKQKRNFTPPRNSLYLKSSSKILKQVSYAAPPPGFETHGQNQTFNQQSWQASNYFTVFSKNPTQKSTRDQKMFMDSIEVDYKQKTFQLMKKNTQLELNIKQSKIDVQTMEKEIQRLSDLIKQIMLSVGANKFDISQFTRTKQSLFSKGIKTHAIDKKIDRSNAYVFSSDYGINKIKQDHLAVAKNPTQEANKFDDKSNRVQNSGNYQESKKNNSLNQQKNGRLISDKKLSNGGNKNNINGNDGQHQSSLCTNLTSKNNWQEFNSNLTYNDIEANCSCSQNYSQIINQYKQIIEIQHGNIMKKDKSNKQFKIQNQELNSIIQQLKKVINQYQSNIGQLENKINALIQQQIKYKGEQFKSQEKIAEQTSKIEKLEENLKEKIKQLQAMTVSNEQLYKQKQKIKNKYRQQIQHFQEMEQLVEEKLIEVQLQMNFYKKQREESFQKIKKLENELKEYKVNEQKKYYSFGQNQKEVGVQVNQIQLDPQETQKIQSNKPILRLKNSENHQITKQSIQYSIQTEFQSPKNSQKGKKIEKQSVDNWKIECYEQSIKTLLGENNRLKNSLLKFYESKINGTDMVVDEQVQIQLKLLLSTGVKDEQIDKENVEQIEAKQDRRGRRFIKQIL